MLKIKLQKVTEDARMPIKGSEHAAAYDVYAHSITEANGKVTVGLGFKTEIPKGYKGIIVPRSNLTKFYWVLNNSYGVIDSDYRGEWMDIFTSLKEGKTISQSTYQDIKSEEFPYAVGDRVAQIYFEEVLPISFDIVPELEVSERGEGGFGSTGLK
jgi:deoxyuridine 5'-triphosphate nucleotidohydrolase